jgi:hypothetical protein
MRFSHSPLVQCHLLRHAITMRPYLTSRIAALCALALALCGTGVTASAKPVSAAPFAASFAARIVSSIDLVPINLVPMNKGSARALHVDAAYAQKKTRDDQGEARKEMKAGNQLSLREIEKLVLPKMRGAEYLGPAYDAAAHAYRLKFIKDGRVMYVDVDARTGKIINRSK